MPEFVLHGALLPIATPRARTPDSQGSTVTYGSTITLQAYHGGILCFNTEVQLP